MLELIRVDGSTEQVVNFSLENLQKLVGGYIEALYAHDGRMLVVDEEGRLKNKPVNPAASAIFGYVVVGDVVVGNRSAFPVDW